MGNYSGLSEDRAKELLEEVGRNELKATKKNPAWKIFISQFTSPLILLLIFVAVISYFLANSSEAGHGSVDTILILLIVFASGLAGFFQEYKADKAIDALKNFSKPKCLVIRNGLQKEILASDLVPGDIIILESGDMIPADAKIKEGNLEINESILTGESHSVKKKLNDEIYSGTSIYSGGQWLRF